MRSAIPALAARACPRYSSVMSTEPPKPRESPFKLNSGRIVLLVLGAVLLIYIASALLGGLTNYQQLKEGALEQKAQPAAPVETAPSLGN